MNTNNLIQRVKNILFTPKNEWKVISSETPGIMKLLLGYILPLALLPTAARIIGTTIFGLGAGWVAGTYGSFSWGLAFGVSYFISVFVTILLAAFVIDVLAPAFKSEKSFGRSLQLVAYSYTPVLIAGILYIIPVLGVLIFIMGLYSIYIIFIGLPDIKKTPDDSKVGYLLISAIVLIVVMIIVSFLLRLIIGGILFQSASPYWLF
ncbi:MAG: Yip1 family protein [Bacteroidetes bacterium]|nr:Yip1 family protein [Bacteroidota bacterium]